jgi:hypothetical protein
MPPSATPTRRGQCTGPAGTHGHQNAGRRRSDRAIASTLVGGDKTVETHVATIFSKLGLEAAPDDHRRVLAVLTWLQRI